MPRGVYDRSKARPRRKRAPTNMTLSARINKLSGELASLSAEVAQVEGIQRAIQPFIAPAPKRRGRPPGSKNKPKNVRRKRGRPRKSRT